MTLKICLAPLRGLTGAIFRNTYSDFFEGIDWAVTPFLTTIQGRRIKPSQLVEVLPENNVRMPVEPQILSRTAEKFIDLACALHDLGYETVNWNLGCPFPRVAGKQRGSGLLPHPDRIDAFLDAVLAAIPNRISIKLRLGRTHPEEIFALLPVFERYPLKSLTIHPRTGVQMYTGHPDLDIFGRCLDQCRCPVIYNGDITTVDGWRALGRRFPGVAAWMIGRGVLADPFLPARIKGLASGVPADGMARFRDFHAALFQHFARVRQGPVQLADTMKGYWTYFASGFPDGRRILKKIRRTRRAEDYLAVVETFFDSGSAIAPARE